ncbi:NAD(P)H-dependent FMN reductase [Knoellia remsis]|uniref:NAD(P)H-dependent FMN reductase n=1 Tax=Knoellia remsis TaxID=407159 RepID=A0A2T0V0X6_9MICO|nr:NADPH-dependent FMN reductase [Knoellia remsis]PRY63728.1 NAD(P)H-dependent FMN reductase [Knoellia remsis]
MSTRTRPLIRLVVGSVRPVRVGDQIAEVLAPVIAEAADAEVEIVDLADLALPLLDEPRMPALGDYAQEHTKAWAATVSGADGIVLLSPQYNGGYPASVKNAIDYLYAEWKDKPIEIVTYGGHGGGLAAKQLRDVLAFIGADLGENDAAITLAREAYGPDWRLADPAAAVADGLDEVRAGARALGERVRGRELVYS